MVFLNILSGYTAVLNYLFCNGGQRELIKSKMELKQCQARSHLDNVS